MKKIFLILLVLSLSLMLFSCGECEKHTDSNGDGICDECEEKIEDNGEDDPSDVPSDEKSDEIELPEVKF